MSQLEYTASWLGRRPDRGMRWLGRLRTVRWRRPCYLAFSFSLSHAIVLLIFNNSFYLRELKSINSLVSEPQALSPRWSRACQIDSRGIGCLGASVAVEQSVFIDTLSRGETRRWSTSRGRRSSGGHCSLDPDRKAEGQRAKSPHPHSIWLWNYLLQEQHGQVLLCPFRDKSKAGQFGQWASQMYGVTTPGPLPKVRVIGVSVWRQVIVKWKAAGTIAQRINSRKVSEFLSGASHSLPSHADSTHWLAGPIW